MINLILFSNPMLYKDKYILILVFGLPLPFVAAAGTYSSHQNYFQIYNTHNDLLIKYVRTFWGSSAADMALFTHRASRNFCFRMM